MFCNFIPSWRHSDFSPKTKQESGLQETHCWAPGIMVTRAQKVRTDQCCQLFAAWQPWQLPNMATALVSYSVTFKISSYACVAVTSPPRAHKLCGLKKQKSSPQTYEKKPVASLAYLLNAQQLLDAWGVTRTGRHCLVPETRQSMQLKSCQQKLSPFKYSESLGSSHTYRRGALPFT